MLYVENKRVSSRPVFCILWDHPAPLYSQPPNKLWIEIKEELLNGIKEKLELLVGKYVNLRNIGKRQAWRFVAARVRTRKC